jgi:hypothetical protein
MPSFIKDNIKGRDISNIALNAILELTQKLLKFIANAELSILQNVQNVIKR